MEAVLGIYEIYSKASSKTYIGSTSDNFKVRWSHHVSRLKRGKHNNPALQRAWEKHGEDNFEFLIIEDMTDATPEDILEAEQWYLDHFKTHSSHGYNIATCASACMLGRKHTLSAIAAMSGQHNPSYGKSPTLETRRKISKGNTGKKRSLASRANISAGCHTKKLSKEQVLFARFLREAWGTTYKELGEYYGITLSSIHRAVTRKTWRFI